MVTLNWNQASTWIIFKLLCTLNVLNSNCYSCKFCRKKSLFGLCLAQSCLAWVAVACSGICADRLLNVRLYCSHRRVWINLSLEGPSKQITTHDL